MQSSRKQGPYILLLLPVFLHVFQIHQELVARCLMCCYMVGLLIPVKKGWNTDLFQF